MLSLERENQGTFPIFELVLTDMFIRPPSLEGRQGRVVGSSPGSHEPVDSSSSFTAMVLVLVRP